DAGVWDERQLCETCRFAEILLTEGVQVGSGVSEVQVAFWARLAGHSPLKLRHVLASPALPSTYGMGPCVSGTPLQETVRAAIPRTPISSVRHTSEGGSR